MTPAPPNQSKRRVLVLCLTYGEPAENEFAPQYEYSLLILNRLTRRVAPIPRFVTPLLAARRARKRIATFREKNWSSPLEGISARQAAVLAELLAEARPDTDFDVRVIREFRPPLLPKVLADIERDPPDDLLIVPLYVCESDFTSGISRTDFETFHRARKGAHRLPGPKYVLGLGFDERFARATADFIWNTCREQGWDEARCRDAALILGAHGTVVTLPPGMNSGAQETGNLFRLIRRELKDRFGWVRIGWLNHQLGGMWTKPSAEEAAREAHERGHRKVVYFPFGFIADNGESMLEGRDQLAVVPWDEMLYLPCPNDNRAYLRVLADLALERLDAPPEEWPAVGRGNPAYERPEMPAERATPGPLKFGGVGLAVLACAFWTMVGTMLTVRGIRVALDVHTPMALILSAAVALPLIWIKGTRVLGRLALKNLRRLRALPQPSPFYRMFTPAIWTVICCMSGLGMLLRITPIAPTLRAGILLGVGGAMLVGAGYYLANLRQARPLTS
ncbi:MAG: ferrochelatase [Candidatus Sumerlaeia bacterium]|nr:ferrochelatase [Candidatus Sumerlaeia bacterium]